MAPTPAMKKAGLLTAMLTAFLAVFAPSGASSPAAAAPMGIMPSRRAALALAREEAAVSDPVKDIAIGGILLAVSLVIALFVFPLLSSGVVDAQNDANTTSRDATLLGLLPTIFIIILVLSAVGYLFKGIKGAFNSK